MTPARKRFIFAFVFVCCGLLAVVRFAAVGKADTELLITTASLKAVGGGNILGFSGPSLSFLEPLSPQGVGFGVTPTFPASVTVGQTNLAASLQIVNTSTPPEDAGTVTLSSITMTPACGNPVPSGGDCAAASADPGVFQYSATGVGVAGTAAAGMIFNITITNPATGQVTFTPTGGPVVLSQPGSPNATARINFTFSVLKTLTKDSSPATPGLQTAPLGFATGTASVNGNTGNGSGTATITVLLSAPTLSTTATATGKVGTAINDTANLGAATPPGPAPTGTITFSLFGPNNATCTGGSAFTSTVAVSSGTGSYTSAPFTPTALGTYRWIASYSGDANNSAATGACNDNGEATAVTAATPTISTAASGSVAPGGTITDTATIASGFNPTGTITFNLFGPNNATCAGAVAFTTTTAVSGNGNYPSAGFSGTLQGTYRWIAAYSGDANNSPVSGVCNDANESVGVGKANPTISTTASAAIGIGGSISDSATLATGSNPTGSITFTLFGPNNATCAGAPAFTSTITVAGNGNYSAANFTPTTAGTYRWIAAYSGDNNNNAISGACNDANESVVVGKANPTIATTASGPVAPGGIISDSATLAAGTGPSGTITFTLFGPDNATCTGAVAFASTVTVAGNGNYGSGNFAPTVAGTYRWVASYSGDANNNSISGACNDAGESVVVGKASPALTTTASAAALFGQTVSDSAALAGGISPTGTITFNLFGPNDATCTTAAVFNATIPVTSGNGTYGSGNFTPTAVGTYRWIANYSGDVNNNAVAGVCGAANESVVVSKANTTTGLTSSQNPSVFGQNVTFTATISANAPGAGVPTGTVTFTIDGVAQAPVNLSGGSASISTSGLTVAGSPHTITAQYDGNANFNQSPLASLIQTVSKATTVTTIQSDDPDPSVVGQSYAVFVSVAAASPVGSSPTGTVTVSDGTGASCTYTLPATNCTLASTTVGTKTLTATYSGDANFNGSNAQTSHTVLLTAPTPTPTPTPTPVPTPTPGNGFEGDINRTAVGAPGTGDGDVNVGDQIQYQRFLSGADCPSLGTANPLLNEQQRLDAGPRDLPVVFSRGDGLLGASDGTAIDAYARHDASTDFNPNTPVWDPTPAGGPLAITNLGCTPATEPESGKVTATVPEPESASAARVVRVVPGTATGRDITVEIEMSAKGNEAGTQYSLHFDPSVVSISDISGVNANPDISSGADSPAGTTFNVNGEGAANGTIGIVENFNATSDSITAISAGVRRIARVTFHVRSGAAAGESKVTFDDSVVKGLSADTNGLILGTTFDQNGHITIPAAAGASVSGRVTTPDGRGMRNATVTIVDRSGFGRTATTSAFGYYVFDNVATGERYVISVASRQYRFASRSIELTDNLTDVDFTGSE